MKSKPTSNPASAALRAAAADLIARADALDGVKAKTVAAAVKPGPRKVAKKAKAKRAAKAARATTRRAVRKGAPKPVKATSAKAKPKRPATTAKRA